MKNFNGNIFLIGLMGAGKTTIGRQLAELLNQTFYDSDHVICEKTGVSIPTIFELEGEQGFRQRESQVIDELTAKQGIVLATGGGVPTQIANQSCLKNRGLTIYLHVHPETLYTRTRHDKNRPLLQVDNPLEKLQQLYALRDPIYRDCAELIIDADYSCTSTTQLILTILKEKGLIKWIV